MTWETFYCGFAHWSREELERRVDNLTHFGDADEVCEAICRMPTPELEDRLYRKALCCGVRFCREELREMGHLPQRNAGFFRAVWMLLEVLADKLTYYRGEGRETLDFDIA